jgi:uncharacterized protein with von Willebrand factor type A (vWA) domain
MTADISAGGNLLGHCVRFGRLLRMVGIAVTPGQIGDAAASLPYIAIGSRGDFKAGLAALWVQRREQFALFDAAFDLFWQTPADPAARFPDLAALAEQLRRQQTTLELIAPVDGVAGSPNDARDDAAHPDRAQTYSAVEILRRKHFASLDEQELAAVRRLMAQMPWRLPLRRARRLAPHPHGRSFDLRRTLRQNLRHGGEAFDLARRQRKLRRRPLVVICDISGSMERYSRLLLQFLYTVAARVERVETFVFSTRLTRITRQLDHHDVDLALAEASRSVDDWAGGTRIGAALRAFNYGWARRVLSRGAVVLIISDGWERGDVTLLGAEMARLQRTAHRIIWLNPLLGDPGYQPLVRGMLAALPHIDDFMPVHNLASLDDLARRLAALDGHALRRF